MSGLEKRYVADAFESNFIAPLGPQLDAFEDRVSAYLGNGLYCVGLSSGSAALHLALRCVGVEAGDEVWISSMTFAGGVFPVLYQNAVPVFFDLDPNTWSMDCDLLEEQLAKANTENRLPRAIVPTDLYGQSVDLDRLEEMSQRYGVALVVDSAESFGATHQNNRKCGTGGTAAILSFNGNKIITTSGGGMLVTASKAIADEARFLSTQARDAAPHYEHSTFGYNYRMSNVAAAIGLGQLEVLDDRVTARRTIFARYENELVHPGLTFMPQPDGYYSSRWLTALTIDPALTKTNREEVRETLLTHGIEARPLWKPMHKQPLFAEARYYGRGVDEALFSRGLCLPSGSDITIEEQSEVIERVYDLL